MKKIALLFACTLMSASSAYAANPLPANLELQYLFIYEGIEVGRATKKLRRLENGNYSYSLWARPTGFARALTSVELGEEGEFTLQSNTIKPVWFADIRRGDRKAYERKAAFDWNNSLLSFSSGEKAPLRDGTQDQASIVYQFMLDPLTHGERIIPITDAKDVEPYRFVFAGRETLRTPLGNLETLVIKRISAKQMEREKECRAQGRYPKGCPVDDFVIWLAPSKQNVAVKLQKRRKNETLTLILDSIQGL